mgnify:CR=1 FL=1
MSYSLLGSCVVILIFAGGVGFVFRTELEKLLEMVTFFLEELLKNKTFKAAAQIWQIKTTNKAKFCGFGCKVQKLVAKIITRECSESAVFFIFLISVLRQNSDIWSISDLDIL